MGRVVMTICLKCKTTNNPGKLYCKKCEAILPVEGENICPKCNVPNGPFAKVCHKCNLALKRQPTSTMKQATVPSMVKAVNTNVTSIKTYKKKKAVNKIHTSLKLKQSMGKTIVMSLLAVLFIIGVIATITS